MESVANYAVKSIFFYLGNLRLMPFEGSTIPTPALWTGDTDKSAHFTSHTYNKCKLIFCLIQIPLAKYRVERSNPVNFKN